MSNFPGDLDDRDDVEGGDLVRRKFFCERRKGRAPVRPRRTFVWGGRARLDRLSWSLTRTAVQRRTLDSQPKRIPHPSARRTIDYTLETQTTDFAHKLSDPSFLSSLMVTELSWW